MKVFESTFSGAKVLITGQTGFKGVWLAQWLRYLGASVTGISISVPTDPSHYEIINDVSVNDFNSVDIRNFDDLNVLISDSEPDFVFHLAAQAIVSKSFKNPLETFSVNALGTVNVLEALRQLHKPVIAVMITSDKAYDNVEWVWGYRETDGLGGSDPYSASKGMAELAIKAYLESYFQSDSSGVRLAVARAGNVIGGGDFAVDRLVPDCMRAWSAGNSVEIRNPLATRPWQHVLEPLSGYLALASDLAKNNRIHGEAFNFGPPPSQNHTVKELIEEMQKSWGQVVWDDVSGNVSKIHEASLLKLNCDKAQSVLGWKPTLGFTETVQFTVDWYKEFYEGERSNVIDLTNEQIVRYTELANLQNDVLEEK